MERNFRKNRKKKKINVVSLYHFNIYDLIYIKIIFYIIILLVNNNNFYILLNNINILNKI